MYSFALLDDDLIVHKQFAAIFERQREQFPDTEIKCFSDCEKFEKYCFGKNRLAGVFVDIDLGENNGINVVRKIVADKKMNTVFITAYPKKTWDIFSANPCGLLIKPLIEKQVVETIKKLIAVCNQNKNTLIFSEHDTKKIISTNDILYIESMGKNILVKTCNSQINTRRKISETEKDLPDYFFRCHRCYIINMKEIVSVRGCFLILSNGKEIPISRSKINSLKELYFKKYVNC